MTKYGTVFKKIRLKALFYMEASYNLPYPINFKEISTVKIHVNIFNNHENMRFKSFLYGGHPNNPLRIKF